MVASPRLVDDLAALLRRTSDAAHLLQRVSLGRSTASGLLAVAELCSLVDLVRTKLMEPPDAPATAARAGALSAMATRLPPLSHLRDVLLRTLDPNASADDSGLTPTASAYLEDDDGPSEVEDQEERMPNSRVVAGLFTPRPLRVQVSCAVPSRRRLVLSRTAAPTSSSGSSRPRSRSCRGVGTCKTDWMA